MKIVPYLYFNGNARDALDLYTKAFKAKLPKIMQYNEQPNPNVPEKFGDKVLHSELIVGDNKFYISDAVGDHEVKVGNNVQINIDCDTEDELRYIYKFLSDGGKISQPIEETFWGAVFTMFTDKYGISWSLNFQKTPMQF